MKKHLKNILALSVLALVSSVAHAQSVRLDKARLKRGTSETVVISFPLANNNNEIILKRPSFASQMTLENLRLTKGGSFSDIATTKDSVLFLKRIPNTAWVRNEGGILHITLASKIFSGETAQLSVVLSIRSKSGSSDKDPWNVDVGSSNSGRQTHPILLPKLED
jgi:hypothetical protein